MDYLLYALAFIFVALSVGVVAYIRSLHSDLVAAEARETTLGSQKKAAEDRITELGNSLVISNNECERLRGSLRASEATTSETKLKLEIAERTVRVKDDENERLYAEYNSEQQLRKVGTVELEYWQYFATRVLHDSRSELGKAGIFLQTADSQSPRFEYDIAEGRIEFVSELLELAESSDMAKTISAARRENLYSELDVLPQLRTFVANRARALEPFTSHMPGPGDELLFNGSWVHLELLLSNMFSNAKRHRISGTPVTFECSILGYQLHLSLINVSKNAIEESTIRAKNEKTFGDRRPRFGLYLIDQIALGYRGFVDLENISEEKGAFRVRSRVRLPIA